jgi:hypothetical protein
MSLSSLLDQFNAVKSQLQQISVCDCSQQHDWAINGLNMMSRPLLLSDVDKVINNTAFSPCALCAQASSLVTSFASLRTQVYEAINTEYELTPETNPFTYD